MLLKYKMNTAIQDEILKLFNLLSAKEKEELLLTLLQSDKVKNSKIENTHNLENSIYNSTWF